VKEEGKMRAAFDHELTELRARLGQLGELVQIQLDRALATLAPGDPDAIQGIVGGDQQTNQLSAEIDWGLLRTLPARPRSPRTCGWSPGCCMSTSIWSGWETCASISPGPLPNWSSGPHPPTFRPP
jgi:hypothetical protein